MSETTVWCEGLPLKARRRVTSEEAVWLSRRHRRAVQSRWLVDAAGVVALAAGIAVMFLSALHTRDTGSNAALVGFVVFPLCLLLMYVCWSLSRMWTDRATATANDIHDGTVLIFARDDAAARVAADSGGAGHALLIEVFASGLLYSVDGVPQVTWRKLSIVRTAPPPALSEVELESSEVVHEDDGARVEVGYRRLTMEERAELNNFVARIKLEYVVVVPILIAAYLGLAGNHYLLHREWWPSPAVAAAAALAMAGTVAYLLYWIGPRVRLGRDARDAAVVVVRREVTGDRGEESDVYVTEYLEHSRLQWSEGGVPAPWRRRSKNGGA